jgi:hypothetical protein
MYKKSINFKEEIVFNKEMWQHDLRKYLLPDLERKRVYTV